MDGGVKLADAADQGLPIQAYADQANLAVARIQVETNNLDQAAARLAQVLDINQGSGAGTDRAPAAGAGAACSKASPTMR